MAASQHGARTLQSAATPASGLAPDSSAGLASDLAADWKVRAPARLGEVSPPPPGRRFTIDGDDGLEARIAGFCATASHGVQRIVRRRKLEALWLGGGYGRGEGGVLRLPGGDQPYNDLEFYIFIRGNRLLSRRLYGPPLRALAEAMGQTARIDVEFHIESCAHLRRCPPSMFYYDLVAGHYVAAGADDLLLARHADPRRLPVSEAARLLMNRGWGLLLAAQRLSRREFSPEAADFVARNIAKAQLAFGDAVLTVYGQYHWSCLERHRRLSALTEADPLPWMRELREHHRAGVEFKLHPQRRTTSAELLTAEHRRVTAFARQVWLWVESRRLGIRFDSPRDYATSRVDKWPNSSPWRNRLLNARIAGPVALWSPQSKQHPRGRVLNQLASLLWDGEGAPRPATSERGDKPFECCRRLWMRCQ